MNWPSGVNFWMRSFAPVGDVDVAARVEVEAPGHVELAGSRAVFAPLQQELAVRGELLDAVVHLVGYVAVAVPVEPERRGAVQLAGRGAGFAPAVEEAGLPVEDGYAGLGLVEYEHALFGVEGEGYGLRESAVAGVVGELGDDVFVEVADCESPRAEAGGVVEDVDAAVGGECHVVWADLASAADGLDVFEVEHAAHRRLCELVLGSRGYEGEDLGYAGPGVVGVGVPEVHAALAGGEFEQLGAGLLGGRDGADEVEA